MNPLVPIGDVGILKKLGMDQENYELPNEQTFVATSKFFATQDPIISENNDLLFE